MVKFKNSDKLGAVADITALRCFGIDKINSIEDLRDAAGANKFSQLCSIKFKSKLSTHKFPTFVLAFVPKLRNKQYHSARKNHAEWYIYKPISINRFDVLTIEQLFINYGFDVNEFFDSDIFQVIKSKFINAIEHSLDTQISAFEKTLTSPNEILELKTYINSINKSIELLKQKYQDINDKYFSLNEKVKTENELDEKIEQELKRQGIYTDLIDKSDIKKDVTEALSDWKCIVKQEIEDNKTVFKVYEQRDKLWVATFPSKSSAEKFAEDYPKMKEKYINS